MALPDNMLFTHTDIILDSGYERIMVEKPGSSNAVQLAELARKAEANSIKMYINYQRSFNGKIASLFDDIEQMVADGYALEYVSIFSCDAA